MKTIFIIIITVFVVVGLNAQQQAVENRLGFLSEFCTVEEGRVRAQWETQQEEFYRKLGSNDVKYVISKLHHCANQWSAELAKHLTEQVSGSSLSASFIRWRSKPTVLKGLKNTSRAVSQTKESQNAPIYGMYCLVQWSCKDDKPAIVQKEVIEDGLKISRLTNHSLTRMDLWIREQDKWYLIPQEVLSFDAALANIEDISQLTKMAEREKKPESK